MNGTREILKTIMKTKLGVGTRREFFLLCFIHALTNPLAKQI